MGPFHDGLRVASSLFLAERVLAGLSQLPTCANHKKRTNQLGHLRVAAVYSELHRRRWIIYRKLEHSRSGEIARALGVDERTIY
jgi:tRNA A37 N6-isopentenylltransferase MiaA